MLSVECTPPTLVSITSSPSSLSAKLCPISVHRSVQEFEFNSKLSRVMPKSYTRGILGKAVLGFPSNEQPLLSCLSITSSY